MKRLCYLLFVTLLLTLNLSAQEKGYFENPIIRGDMSDPSIIRIGDTYYATGSSSEWAPFYPVCISKDLINWEQKGYIFEKKPDWTSTSFWAPELYYHNNKVYCYYTARRKSDGVSYIGVATAASPLDEFTDHGTIVEYGTEAIDAFIYNDNGQLYISWKAYGLDKRPIELIASRLSDDGLRLEGEPFSLLVDDENIGMEGQYHFKQGEYYYIIYAAHGCCGPQSDYDVYVARSKSFRGPYEKYAGNPILYGGEGEYLSIGHGTAVTTPDGRLFYMCHAYLKGEGFYAGRQPVLQEMYITDDNWIQFKTGSLALRKQAVPFTGTVQNKVEDFKDDFKQPRLKPDWSWNYPFSDIEVKTDNGKLILNGIPKDGNYFGTAFCIRPQTSEYSYQTSVLNKNNSLKGLTMYGDDKNLIVWGIQGDKILLKLVKDGQESVEFESDYNMFPVHLKTEVEKGCFLSFLWSKDGKSWTRVNNAPIDTKYLVRWDRVARPGLIHIGERSVPAEFGFFELVNH